MIPFLAKADRQKLVYKPLINLDKKKVYSDLKMPLSLYTDIVALSKSPYYLQERPPIDFTNERRK